MTAHLSEKIRLLLVFCSIALSSCTVGPDFKDPEPGEMVKDVYRLPVAEQPLSMNVQPVISWWNRFDDEQLSDLVHRLFSSSLALEQARERVREACARQGIVSADKRLQLSAALGYTRAETGDEAVSLQGLRPGKKFDLFSAGVVAGWELDLWGRTGRLLEAAEQDVRVSYAEYHGMLVSLAAEMALSYIDARILEQRMALIEKNIELQRRTLTLAKARLEAGNGNELAVVRAEGLIESSEAVLPELKRQLRQATSRINVLLGKPRNTEILKPGAMPGVPSLIGIGLPANLVCRRPDIRRALAAYHGAVARIGAAQAERYPTLTLSGNLTMSSDKFSGLFDRDSFIYSLGPGLKFPLFTGGRIDSNVAVRSSQAEQARLAMEQKIIEALSEVENGAEGVVRSRQRVDRLTEAERHAKNRVALASELYRAGLSDLFQVLDSEQALVGAQESLLLARQQALSQVVGLYRALGGGWEQGPPVETHEPVETEENEKRPSSS